MEIDGGESEGKNKRRLSKERHCCWLIQRLGEDGCVRERERKRMKDERERGRVVLKLINVRAKWDRWLMRLSVGGRPDRKDEIGMAE